MGLLAVTGNMYVAPSSSPLIVACVTCVDGPLLVLQPEIVTFMVGWLAGGSGRFGRQHPHRRPAVAGAVHQRRAGFAGGVEQQFTQVERPEGEGTVAAPPGDGQPN
jgi:hypothetical protein